MITYPILTPGKKRVTIRDFNDMVKDYRGSLDDYKLKITLSKFLISNIGLTYRLISGFNLFPWQEIMLKGLFLKDNALIVAARGAGKSAIISVFSSLYPLLRNDIKICLISSNFRNARRIFENSEKIINSKGGDLIKECFSTNPKRLPDMIDWKLENGSSIFALPLSNGEGLRGTRANVVLVDEGLLISKEIQEVILKPFLTVKSNVNEDSRLVDAENELIERGEISEIERLSSPRNKYHIFSSASYQFEYLYQTFTSYIKNALNEPKAGQPSYFVIRIAYDAIPENQLFDAAQIQSAKNDGENTTYFQKEYRALFPGSSNSYFNIQKMHECTVVMGDNPTVQIIGDSHSEYILTIDPAYGSSKTNDFFAMGVYLVNKDERKITLVHTYGKAGAELKDQHEYLTFLLLNFNIVFMSIDSSGDEFLKGYNESVIAKDNKILLGFIDCKFDDDATYMEEIHKAKTQYNLSDRRFVYRQLFSAISIRRMNEYLQNRIEAKKVFFGSSICSNQTAFQRYMKVALPASFKNKNESEYAITDFIEEQDNWIRETKAQIALVEVKTTSSGVLQYDLPISIKSKDNANRPRKDNYTTLLLANYASKIYFDIIFAPFDAPNQETFMPCFVA